MADNHVDRINQAIAKREFVRIRRRFDHAFVHGYVLASGTRHFVMAVVDDRLWYDGFEGYRLKDVHSVEADPHAAFAESALRLRRARPGRGHRAPLPVGRRPPAQGPHGQEVTCLLRLDR
jgi:hypothetical protein